MTDVRNHLVLEIVELEGGELAIRNPERAEKPLLKINFSEELKEMLNEQCLDVARAMLTAGIQMVAQSGAPLGEQGAELVEDEVPTIH